jgi:hypothetical protein
LQKQIHFKLQNKSLKNLLDTVCRQADIRYFLVGTQIVLKKIEQTTAAVKDSNTVVSVDSSNILVVPDTVNASVPAKRDDTYQMDKKYKKYFFSVFGKRRLPDSMIVVSSNGTKDTIVEKTKQYRYINKTNIHEKFAVGLFGGPGIAYRTIKGDDRFVTERNRDESNVVNYVLGAQATYYLHSLHLSFRSSLNYMTLGEKGAYDEIILIQQQPTGGGGSPGPPAEITVKRSYQNRYSYLMLPVLVGYNFHINNRLNISAHSGIAFAFLVRTKSTYEETINGSQTTNLSHNPFLHSYNDMSFVLPVQIEASYQLTSQTHLFVAPMFNYFLTSIYSKNDWNTEKPYALNFSIGLTYFFKEKK